ncbi:radical SAM protein [Paenibacillus sp. VT-400]|uniref:radical SAM protein n=1 Tax=Paenibacillus TaxID=44249 RepID=UPI000649606F|nr:MULTISPECIES: radical SAM protein [Paenibacillus]KLU58138.1 radical SAM protein [Paenibacillus sp. VT-400]MCP1424703.1 radical SAM protein with 4Fe4S-binding SPASM domain [Paenibacillus xylanexedens]
MSVNKLSVVQDKTKTSYPRWIVMQLLEECNLRCKMCYEWGLEGPYKSKKTLAHLDPDLIKKIIVECSPGKPYYDFFGGEPLMYPWLSDILAMINHYGSIADFPTNGTLLEQHAEMLVETAPNKIWMSLDGPEEINDRQRGKGVFKKVIKGIEKLYELRESKGKQFPKMGVSFIITPLNYMYVEEFFFKHIDLSMLDHISMEVQLYATEEQYAQYVEVLSDKFDVHEAPYAKGMVWRDTSSFSQIDIPELTRQLNNVKAYCLKNRIHVITYPKTIDEQNLSNYFSGQFHQMADKRNRCSLPWVYAEITARGDVSPCHAFYDLTFGNVNEESLLDIWSSDKYKDYRAYMKKNMLPICTACSRYYIY